MTAARAGAQVLLVERNGYLGGQLGSGLPFLAFWDIKGRQVVGGIAQEFVDRLEQAGASYGHEYCPHHQSVTLIHPFYSRILCFEMVKEAGVELLMHCELADVKMKDGKIRTIIVSGKGQHIEITADVFIDGTGDGDLGALSGAETEKGNENKVMQPPTLMFNLGGVNFEKFVILLKNTRRNCPTMCWITLPRDIMRISSGRPRVLFSWGCIIFWRNFGKRANVLWTVRL